MTPEVLNAFLALYAASSGVSLAYLSLPDYRYRNSITEYFKYYVDRTVRLHEKFITKEVQPESVLAMIGREKARQCSAEAAGTKNDAMKTEPWLRFLEDLLEMPKGHVPNSEILIAEEDLIKHRTDKKNWFLTKAGWCFRNIYMVHRDNSFVTILAAMSLTLLATIISLIIFSVKIPTVSYDVVATGIWTMLAIFFLVPLAGRIYRKQHRSNGFYFYLVFAAIFVVLTYSTYQSTPPAAVAATASTTATTAAVTQSGTTLLASVLLFIGLLALIFPAVLAYLGRRVICETARTAIHDAVESLLSAELNDEASEWVKKVADATKAAPAVVPANTED